MMGAVSLTANISIMNKYQITLVIDHSTKLSAAHQTKILLRHCRTSTEELANRS